MSDEETPYEAMVVADVGTAWSAVMGSVRAIEKRERNKAQGFSFRGVDTVVNAVGPAMREHGVAIIPVAQEIIQSNYTTGKGTAMVNTVVKMAYTIVGPDGSTLHGSAYGEASDAGDKSVSKAESVAYRVFLLQALCIPTDEADPDAEVHERAEPEAERVPASAQDRGFKNESEAKQTWDALIADTAVLPSPSIDELRAWVMGNGLTKDTITAAEAADWASRLAAVKAPNTQAPQPSEA